MSATACTTQVDGMKAQGPKEKAGIAGFFHYPNRRISGAPSCQ
jgi:hypothetical protein